MAEQPGTDQRRQPDPPAEVRSAQWTPDPVAKDEDEARQMIRRLVQAEGGQWREQGSDAATQPPR
ncbi:hypothetical protein [Micromonospora sp. DT47]|uniref:hypothetical protein n=1 Tax=Micromonospora sp. DT47 TaxID=3393431 RepID=UPI003CEF77B5